MGLLSIRIPDELEKRLDDEAQRLHSSRSAIAREAIESYLQKLDRVAIEDALRKAGGMSSDEDVSVAEEALPYDNESLGLEDSGTRRDVWPPKWWR